MADIDDSAAKAAAAELSGSGVQALGALCDVSSRSEIEALAEFAWTELGHVDIVVNNAGVISPMRQALNIEERDARWVLEVNVLGTLFGCSVFGRRFIEQGTPAHILNTGYENSFGVPHTGAVMYTASKHAVLGLTDVLRGELPDFIGVSILCPGMVRTNLASAGQHRPERFGGPIPSRPGAGPMLGLDPDEVGRRAVEGIKRRDFYIVTHPPVRELVEERAAEIAAAFDAHVPRFAGDQALDTRAMMRRPAQ